MLTKELIIESIRNMPEEKFEDLDVLLERLVMLEKIYIGLEQADKGESIPVEDVLEEIKKW